MNAAKDQFQEEIDPVVQAPVARRVASQSSEIDALLFLGAGERRYEPLTGVKALMLAVLEDGIRCYLSLDPRLQAEAEHWVDSPQRKLVFSFEVICDTFAIEASAARRMLRALRGRETRAMPTYRTRPNVRHNTLSVVRKRRRRKASTDAGPAAAASRS